MGKKGCWPCLIRWCMASSPALQGSAQLAFSRDRTSSGKNKKIYSLTITSCSYNHKQAVINQMCISRGKKKLLRFPSNKSLSSAWSECDTLYWSYWVLQQKCSTFLFIRWCERSSLLSTERYDEDDGAWQLRSKVPVCRGAEAALFSAESGTDVSLWLLSQTSLRDYRVLTHTIMSSLLICAKDTHQLSSSELRETPVACDERASAVVNIACSVSCHRDILHNLFQWCSSVSNQTWKSDEFM